MEKENWIKKHPILRFTDIARRFKSREYARVFVYRMVKKGQLKRIKRGVYTSTENIFSIASNIYYPSYISFLSASYYYGFTEAIPISISTAVPKRHNTINFEGYKLEFIQMNEIWGYHKEGSDEAVFIADVEKLMLDCFIRPAQMGNFSEIENVFVNNKKIDINKLKQYLKRFNSNKVSRKIGYMLEKHKGIDLSPLIKIDRNYYTLNPFEDRKGKKLDRKWRLFV